MRTVVVIGIIIVANFYLGDWLKRRRRATRRTNTILHWTATNRCGTSISKPLDEPRHLIQNCLLKTDLTGFELVEPPGHCHCHVELVL